MCVRGGGRGSVCVMWRGGGRIYVCRWGVFVCVGGACTCMCVWGGGCICDVGGWCIVYIL